MPALLIRTFEIPYELVVQHPNHLPHTLPAMDPLSPELPPWTPPPEEEKAWTRDSLRADALDGKFALIGHLIRQQVEGGSDPSDCIDMLEHYHRSRPAVLNTAFRAGVSLGELVAMSGPLIPGAAQAHAGMNSWQKILIQGICMNIDRPGCGMGKPVKFNLQFGDFEKNAVSRFFIDGGENVVLIELLKGPVNPGNRRLSYGGDDTERVGPILPAKYAVVKKSSGDQPSRAYFEAWLRSDENWLAFDGDEGVTSETVNECVSMLEAAAAKVSPEAQQAFAQSEVGKSPKGFFQLSYLHVKNPNEKARLEAEPCSNPDCGNRGVKHCSKCRRARYCGKECQKSHWKQHKKSCALDIKRDAESLGNRPSALVDPSDAGTSKGMSFQSFSIGSAASKAGVMGKDRMRHVEGEFIVKVQGSAGGMCPFMIYDQKRVCQTSCPPDNAAGNLIRNYLSQFPSPYPGQSPHPALAKCYLFARTEGGGLRVFLDQIAPWQTW